ncbi:SRPBCC family protein [Hyphomicrobium sp.]|uniref:SRPBCC family protein n=1 Tax=Hyphomicrobium sp. TaxID=82 RepID=UPI0025C4B19F|nr:SRPBCC family protein [Hyphomicrobium sp.]MCC7253988.1 SRPBCC family protein [Hyphomicrobium sp.]
MSSNGRTDSASRVIAAPPATIYQALVDPHAVAAWRPPKGMRGEIFAFEARQGGTYRMALIYESNPASRGKSCANTDVVEGRFLEFVPEQRVVERVRFDTPDPAFAGEMTITTTLAPVDGGTEVTVVCENVPEGITAADHEAGLTSTLANLAAFTE